MVGRVKIKNVSLSPNKNAFSLLESIMALLVTIIIFTMIPFLLQTEKKILNVTNISHSAEWHIFVKQLREEIGNGKIHIRSDNKFCSISNKEICYEFYKDVIRKQVDGKGHETLLTNVAQFSMYLNDAELSLKIKTTANKNFTTMLMMERE
ncbi:MULTISPECIES: competence type IV pilus minor pilin ComGF [Listeria]|uniref:competence type IV pilus minor pilin ComGF n=1 Tax=Listeria TaxID=1637 RepID=UPI000B587ADD|nr:MULTISPECIES: competence type IV pilus minor pilin ComGF [Listeria]